MEQSEGKAVFVVESAPVRECSLRDLLIARGKWPVTATCATQDSDGEVVYWNAAPRDVRAIRARLGHNGMMAEVGLKYQVDAWFSSLDNPVCAADWREAVVEREEVTAIIAQGVSLSSAINGGLVWV